MLSGRRALRAQVNGMKRKGAGWTRSFRKGREQRHPRRGVKHADVE